MADDTTFQCSCCGKAGAMRPLPGTSDPTILACRACDVLPAGRFVNPAVPPNEPV